MSWTPTRIESVKQKSNRKTEEQKEKKMLKFWLKSSRSMKKVWIRYNEIMTSIGNHRLFHKKAIIIVRLQEVLKTLSNWRHKFQNPVLPSYVLCTKWKKCTTEFCSL